MAARPRTRRLKRSSVLITARPTRARDGPQMWGRSPAARAPFARDREASPPVIRPLQARKNPRCRAGSRPARCSPTCACWWCCCAAGASARRIIGTSWPAPHRITSLDPHVRLIRQRANLGVRRFDEIGDDGGVDQICWLLADGVRRRREPVRIDDDDGQAGADRLAATTVPQPLVALEAHDRGPEAGQAAVQRKKPRPSVLVIDLVRPTKEAELIELVLGDARFDNARVHPIHGAQAGPPLRPKRLFGFDGTADEDLGFSTGLVALAACRTEVCDWPSNGFSALRRW